MAEPNHIATERIRVRRVFISAHDKTDLVRFASFLTQRRIEVYATKGTANHLREASVAVRPANELTGFGELLSGKVKSLSPRLHAGILFSRASGEETAQIEEQGFLPIDMVVVTFYPFKEVVNSTPLAEATTMIDIGGPAALRAASKNFRWVIPVPEPASYSRVMEDILEGETLSPEGEPSVSLRLSLELAARTFAITADYEAMVESYLLRQLERFGGRPEGMTHDTGRFPEHLRLVLEKIQKLRYGENPHQRASFYRCVTEQSFTDGGDAGGETEIAGQSRDAGLTDKGSWGKQLQGKELSFNNLLDLDAAVSACREFRNPGCVVIKHRNPCGASETGDLFEAYVLARDCDPLSAFGGVVAVNRPVTEALASEMTGLFLELVAAPAFETGAVRVFSKKKNLRLVELLRDVMTTARAPRTLVRSGPGGLLFQEEDSVADRPSDWKVVSERVPTAEEIDGLFFLWKVVRHVVSNAIVIGTGNRTLGMGAGQTSRIDAVEVALMKANRAGHDVSGAWLASDGFFPFRDAIDRAASAGVRAIVQPGGSIRDDECIRAANEHGIAMCFTGRRCFKH